METITFKGVSGTGYQCKAYDWGTQFNAVAAVYVVTYRYISDDHKTKYRVIYVGETGDLSERFENHHKADCFAEHNANTICIYRENDDDERLVIEKDLIAKYDPPCNG